MTTRSRYIAGALEFFDSATHARTRREVPHHFHDNFSLYSTIPDAGSRANGSPWVKKITGAAPPTLTLGADAAGGVMISTLTNASQAQAAVGHWDDNRHFDLTKKLVYQAKARLTTLPTLVAECNLGMQGDHADGILNTTYNAGFILDAAGAVSAIADDNVDAQSASTGVTMVVNDWYWFRVEFFDVTAVRYFINGALVATLKYAATGANAILQPVFGCYKASGAGVGVAELGHLDIWQDL